MSKKSYSSKLFFLLSILFFIIQVQAITVSYTLTDLIDVEIGKDLWEYSYFIEDAVFDEFYGFQIFFENDSYVELIDPAPFVNDDWDVLVFQKDPFFGDPAIYDAMALTDNASLDDAFNIQFIWDSVELPGDQVFEIYDSNFSVIDSVITTNNDPVIPEPMTFVMMFSGLLGLFFSRKKA